MNLILKIFNKYKIIIIYLKVKIILINNIIYFKYKLVF